MLVLRASKTMAVAVAAMGLLVSLVAFGNLTDYDTNFAFVQHVLLMDTTFPSSTIRYRAITNPALHHAAYALIIESMQTRGDWLPVELGFGPTERGCAGAEAGMACEAGGGAASRRDNRDRGRAH